MTDNHDGTFTCDYCHKKIAQRYAKTSLSVRPIGSHDRWQHFHGKCYDNREELRHEEYLMKCEMYGSDEPDEWEE
jgi:hypothetical protein